jgi:hypothetical protein
MGCPLSNSSETQEMATLDGIVADLGEKFGLGPQCAKRCN